MTLNQVLKQLKALADDKIRAHNAKNGAGDNQFGVKHGDIRVLAKEIKADHKLMWACPCCKSARCCPSSRPSIAPSGDCAGSGRSPWTPIR